MKYALLGMLALALGGCMITDREALYYTRSDIDAINVTAQCKAMARNLLQLSRCDTRR